MGNVILWHLLPSDRPISAHSIETSVPTRRSTCLVSAVRTQSSAFRLSAMSKAQRSCYSPRVCGQLSGGAHSHIVQSSNVPHYGVFYVQHKIRAGYGGGCLSQCFSTGFGSLSDNISFFCPRPDSVLWRWFSHGKQQVEWKRSCSLKSSGWLLLGIRNICVQFVVCWINTQ